MSGVPQRRTECKSGKLSLLWLRRQRTGIIHDDAYSSELYNLLISAISVLPASETNSLIIKAIAAAIAIPNVFNVQALLSLPAMAQLRADKNPAYDFLQVFLT